MSAQCSTLRFCAARMSLVMAGVGLACLPGVSAMAGDVVGARPAAWDQYLGPDRNNISTETGWKAQWPPEGPRQLWKTRVGTGFATVTLRGNRLYTMGYVKDSDIVYCLNADTGEEIWKYPYPAKLMAKQHEGGPCATPALDGNLVFTHGKEGQLLCLDAEKGGKVWEKDLRKELGAKVPTWGFAGSPLVEGDLLITDAGYAVAFDKKTGKQVWKSAEDYGAGYSSPVALDLNGKRCVAVFNAYGLVVLTAADGKELSRFRWDTNYGVNAATPLISGNEVFISSGYNRGAALLRLAGAQPEVVWENKNMRNHFNTSVVWKGHIYGFDENKLSCLEYKTGKPLWSKSGLGKGSLTLADGKLLILSERGELITAEPDPTEFKAISSAHVLGGKCWTVPVLFDGKIYCRNAAGDLTCLSVRGG